MVCNTSIHRFKSGLRLLEDLKHIVFRSFFMQFLKLKGMGNKEIYLKNISKLGVIRSKGTYKGILLLTI